MATRPKMRMARNSDSGMLPRQRDQINVESSYRYVVNAGEYLDLARHGIPLGVMDDYHIAYKAFDALVGKLNQHLPLPISADVQIDDDGNVVRLFRKRPIHHLPYMPETLAEVQT